MLAGRDFCSPPCDRFSPVSVVWSYVTSHEAEMIPPIPESVFAWLNLVGNMVPPRDPYDDDDEDEEEDDREDDEDQEPAVIREPDEGE